MIESGARLRFDFPLAAALLEASVYVLSLLYVSCFFKALGDLAALLLILDCFLSFSALSFLLTPLPCRESTFSDNSTALLFVLAGELPSSIVDTLFI